MQVNIIICLLKVIRYFWLICLITLERKCFKIFQLGPVKRSSRIKTWQAAVNKTGLKLELLTDIDMLLMVKKELDA